MPGLVRPISTSAPLQFNNNNNNSVHVVNNASLPAYSLPSTYGLNLSAKPSDCKTEMKEPAKRNHEDETMSSSSTSRHSTSSMPLIIASIDDLDHGIGRGLLFVPIVNSSMDFFLTCSFSGEPGQNSTSKSVDRESQIPLNLSTDDDKKAKRASEMTQDSPADLERIKRAKTEQTEATDLSMKTSTSASLGKISIHQVRRLIKDMNIKQHYALSWEMNL